MTQADVSPDAPVQTTDERRPELYRQVILAAIIGVTMAVVAFQAARDLDKRRLESEFKRLADDRITAFDRVVSDHVNALDGIETHYAASEVVEAEEFALFVTRSLNRRAGLAGIAWAPVAGGAEGADETVLIEYAQPADRHALMLGVDLLAIPECAQAMDEAVRTGGHAACRNPSSPVLAGNVGSVVVFLPVPGSDGTDATSRFPGVAGFLVAGMEFDRLLDQALAMLPPEAIDVRILDNATDEWVSTYTFGAPGADGEADRDRSIRRRGPIVLAGRRLTVLCTSTPTFAAKHAMNTPEIVLLAGLLVTVVATGYLFSLVGRTAQVERLVVVRTAALTRTKETLARRVDDLEKALAEVHQLRALLPICSYCKRVKEGEEYSKSVEAYIAQHSPTQFSHGVCPDCYAKYVKPQLEEL